MHCIYNSQTKLQYYSPNIKKSTGTANNCVFYFRLSLVLPLEVDSSVNGLRLRTDGFHLLP